MATLQSIRKLFNSEERLSLDEYNFNHFRTWHLLQDIKRTIIKEGISPGALAPDFELPCVSGGSLRLRDLYGKPVLLHFGSLS